MQITPQQQAAIESTSPLTFVIAGAGSGKTSTIIERIKWLTNKGVRRSRIVALTFTNAAAKEIETRIRPKNISDYEAWSGSEPPPRDREFQPLGFIGTLHSFCLKLLRENASVIGYKPRINVLSEDDAEAFLKDFHEKHLLMESMSKLKTTVAQGPPDLSPYIDGGIRRLSRTELVAADYYKELKAANLMTFDAILIYAERLLKTLREQLPWNHFLIDECQDSNPIDFRIYGQLVGDRYFVGDPDQCQPAGTLIAMADGTQLPIEEIKPGDAVRSYCRHSKVILKSATVAHTAGRTFSGMLYSVTADGKTASSTGNHKWLIRWLTGAERAHSLYCTYLMRKGDCFRVGMTKFFRSSGETFNNHQGHIIGAALRLNQERADAIWILKLHNTVGESVAYEEIVSSIYGLPQACFIAQSNQTHYTQDVLDTIFRSIPNQLAKAVRCLQDHGRELEFPIISTSQKRTRRTVQEIHACNLLDAVMNVPVGEDHYVSKKRGSRWAPIHVSTQPFFGTVYSLDVVKHHKYISNGIVTCNSIYAFRGAALDLCLSLVDTAKVFPLEDNFRCAQEICEHAQLLIEHNKNRYPKVTRSASPKRGVIGVSCFEIPAEEMSNIAIHISRSPFKPSEIAVLLRTNDLVREFATHLRSVGIPIAERVYKERPADFRKAMLLLSFLNNPDDDYVARKWISTIWSPDVLNEVSEKARESLQTLNQFRMRIERPSTIMDALQHFHDLRNPDPFSQDTLTLIHQIASDLPAGADIADLILAIGRHDHGEEIGEGVFVGTIHSAKGREWSHVFLPAFEQHLLPGDQKKSCNIEEERRLAYVAFTRAKEHLSISFCQKRLLKWGGFSPVDVLPSRFIAEAGLSR